MLFLSKKDLILSQTDAILSQGAYLMKFAVEDSKCGLIRMCQLNNKQFIYM